MSSRLSAREGVSTGTTLSLWNRSSLKRPSSASLRRSRDVVEMIRTSTSTGRRAADAFEPLIDEDAQNFPLRLKRHVADFVEHQGAAMGALHEPD